MAPKAATKKINALKAAKMHNAMKAAKSVMKKPSSVDAETPDPAEGKNPYDEETPDPYRDAEPHGQKVPPAVKAFLDGTEPKWGQRQIQSLKDWCVSLKKKGHDAPIEMLDGCKNMVDRQHLCSKLALCKTKGSLSMDEIKKRTTHQEDSVEGGRLACTCYDVPLLLLFVLV